MVRVLAAEVVVQELAVGAVAGGPVAEAVAG